MNERRVIPSSKARAYNSSSQPSLSSSWSWKNARVTSISPSTPARNALKYEFEYSTFITPTTVGRTFDRDWIPTSKTIVMTRNSGNDTRRMTLTDRQSRKMTTTQVTPTTVERSFNRNANDCALFLL